MNRIDSAFFRCTRCSNHSEWHHAAFLQLQQLLSQIIDVQPKMRVDLDGYNVPRPYAKNVGGLRDAIVPGACHENRRWVGCERGGRTTCKAKAGVVQERPRLARQRIAREVAQLIPAHRLDV